MAKILIAGCGDIGLRLAGSLIKQGHAVTGLRRSLPDRERRHADLAFYRADLTQQQTLSNLERDFDVVFFILTPDRRDAESYRRIYLDGLKNLQNHFSDGKPCWFFISSTSVYGQNQGQWVDEVSPTQPISETSRYILDAENLILAENPRNIIVRFSGIYGQGRERLLKKAMETEEIQHIPPVYTNRIHQDDCARVLAFLLREQLAGRSLASCYLASDDEPVATSEVILWIREQLGYPAPTLINKEQETPQNKCCSNARLKAQGFICKFPTYKEGYLPLIELTKNTDCSRDK